MKKTGDWLFSGILLFLVIACGDKENPVSETIELNTYELMFDEKAGSQYINLSTKAQWTIEASDNSWLECIPGSGTGNTRLEVKTTDNTVTAIRNGNLKISTKGNVSRTLKVTQAAASSSIELNPATASLHPDGEEVTVAVTGKEWDVTIPPADTWLSIKAKTSNSVTFTAGINGSGAGRSSVVVFSSPDGLVKTSCTLSQAKSAYLQTADMVAAASAAGYDYSNIDKYMDKFGFDYSENPHCSGGYGGHNDGTHCEVEKDDFLNQYVFRFNIHITPVIDGDRCGSSTTDRQRNEMKSITNNSTWAKVQGNWDEWQIVEWKFKLAQGFQPTSSFCHIHQLKAQDGPNNGSALITITPRAGSSGSNKRMQIIHSVDGASTGKGTVVDNIPLSDFEGEWVQVKEEIHYAHNGYYSCLITRIRDGKVLVNFKDENIDMWRIGASYIRTKFGIYRSLAGGDLSKNPVGQSSLLKNESIWLTDFKIYEKNTNPTPGAAHD